MIKEIRLATEQDLPRIQEIYKPYVEQRDIIINSEYRVPTLDELKERFNLVTKEFPWLVYEIDGVIVAYAYAGRPFKREGYKWDAEVSVYTDINYHGKRLASGLYECLLEILKIQGIYNVYACILSGNEKSVKFHEKYGFDQMCVFPKAINKFERWLDVIWMNKTLQDFEGNIKPPIKIGELDLNILKNILNKKEDIIKG